MTTLPPGPSLIQCRNIIASISSAFASNTDVTVFQRVNRATYDVVTPMVWKVIPSALPLLQLFSSLTLVSRRKCLVLLGPVQSLEVEHFQHYANHVVQINILYDAVDKNGCCIYDLSDALDMIAKHSAQINLFPRLKSIGMAFKFLNTNTLCSAFRFQQISSLTLAVRTFTPVDMASIISDCGLNLQKLHLTGECILDPRIATSIKSLTRLNTLFIDMSMLDPLQWGAYIPDWKHLVLQLPDTVDIVHIISPPASPVIVKPFCTKHMQYICIHTSVTEFCAFLPAIEYMVDTPVILQVRGPEVEENRLRKAISLADINMDLNVVENIAVMCTTEGKPLKRPLISTRDDILDIVYQCDEVASMFASFYR